MAIFSEQEVRSRAGVEKSRSVNINKSCDKILTEESRSFSENKIYDIFLSHCVKDSELVLGMNGILKDLGYSVYVDWIEDPKLDRSKVNIQTADLLRQRMAASNTLLFVTTDNSTSSKWMPWECGYFDALKQKVAIIPIKSNPTSDEYTGQEYLGLYPYCLKAKANDKKEYLFIHRDKNHYVPFDEWTNNSKLEWREQ